MARKTMTTTAIKAKAKANVRRRVMSLEPRSTVLTSLEEAVVRMHHGVSVKSGAQLPTNGVTDELMGQLFEMEVRAHVESGRIDALPDVPATKASGKGAAARSGSHRGNARTAKVVAELKKKK
jgi:hypothetical protein